MPGLQGELLCNALPYLLRHLIGGAASLMLCCLHTFVYIIYSCGNRFKNVVAIVCQNLTSDIESIDYMFTCCESLTTISGLDTWNTSNLKSMRYTFAGCESLENIANLEDLDTSSLQDISNIFGRYNVPIHEKISYNTAYVLDGVRNYSKTSFACEKIRNVKEKLNKWDMSNIVEKSDAFSGCVDLED